MNITRVSRDGNSYRTSVPRPIFDALKMSSGDYVIWTWHSNGYAEVRRVQHPTQPATTAKARR